MRQQASLVGTLHPYHTSLSMHACRIQWTEEADRLCSIESQGLRHNGSDLARTQHSGRPHRASDLSTERPFACHFHINDLSSV